MTCEDCGSDEGYETTCPYTEDIEGEIVECVLCGECYHDRCMDI